MQVEIFRRTIKRTPGERPMTQKDKRQTSYNMREQYESVRVYAQQYNVFRDRMRGITSGDEFQDDHPEFSAVADVGRSRYKALLSNHIRCDTRAYDALNSHTFKLPWFWKLTARRDDISDENFVHECKGVGSRFCRSSLNILQFSGCDGSTRGPASIEVMRRSRSSMLRWA